MKSMAVERLYCSFLGWVVQAVVEDGQLGEVERG